MHPMPTHMETVLKDVPEQPLSVPEGVLMVNVDPVSGLRVAEGQGVPEFFYQEFLPPEHETLIGGVVGGERRPEDARNQLF